MSDTNGSTNGQTPAIRPATYAEIVASLPYLTDRERGMLRSKLTFAQSVCRERDVPAPVGSHAVNQKPRATDTE